jgi:type VI protein secretion system component VasK
MLYGEQNTFRRTPGLVTWLFWVVLTAFGGIVGTFLLSIISEANASLNGLLIWFYLASPLFFVALGQWLLLRRFVAQSGWWLLTGILGFIFVYPNRRQVKRRKDELKQEQRGRQRDAHVR